MNGLCKLNVKYLFFQVSALTVDCLEIYRDAVCKTCDAVDSNIKVRRNGIFIKSSSLNDGVCAGKNYPKRRYIRVMN